MTNPEVLDELERVTRERDKLLAENDRLDCERDRLNILYNAADKVLTSLRAENERLKTPAPNPGGASYRGWKIIDDSGDGVLIEGPLGHRRRVWFEWAEIERLRAEVERLTPIAVAVAQCSADEVPEAVFKAWQSPRDYYSWRDRLDAAEVERDQCRRDVARLLAENSALRSRLNDQLRQDAEIKEIKRELRELRAATDSD